MISKLMKKTNLPRDIFGVPVMTVEPQKITIVNYRKLFSWSTNEIETNNYVIKGTNFVITTMDKIMISIKGDFKQIILKGDNDVPMSNGTQ